jgi:hypothetical protein
LIAILRLSLSNMSGVVNGYMPVRVSAPAHLNPT